MLPIFWNTYFKISKKIETQNSHVHLHVLHVHKVVARQIECHVACVKKIKFDAKNKAFYMTIFVIFTLTIKRIGFRWNFTNALRLWICKCKKKNWFFFEIPKYVFFWVDGVYAPGNRIEFPKRVLLLLMKLVKL
jgi:hypothetical protein